MARWLPSQKNNMLRRRRVSGDLDDARVKYRISSMQKMMMLAAALAMDVAPFLIGIVVFLMPTILGSAAGAALESHYDEKARIACRAAVDDGFFSLANFWCFSHSIDKTISQPVGTGAGAGLNLYFSEEMFVIANGMKTASSMGIAFFSALFFGLWFALNGVYVFAPKQGKMTTNFFTALIELIPLFGTLIPGITFATWRHIRISRAEDKKKAEKRASSQMALA